MSVGKITLPVMVHVWSDKKGSMQVNAAHIKSIERGNEDYRANINYIDGTTEENLVVDPDELGQKINEETGKVLNKLA